MANKLENERSPYLQQHKDNPVDWWAWSEEAFAAAASQDKPVFLSIGYSTCHWCHVMEHESFEDHEVAALLNAAFVNIKVDREERPDIDTVYMTVCQMMTGRGGWPLTIIMTPDRRPFFAATYIPKASGPGRIGIMDLVPRVANAWRARRNDLMMDADRVTRALSDAVMADTSGDEPNEASLHRAFGVLQSNFDAVNGGFGYAPKFPSPTSLRFLLRYWKRTGQAGALQMVGQTLTAMRRGGIYDHVGWGFHRYATDAAWTVPHFEKMLHDQATLALTYTEAYQATGEELFRQTADEILRYVLRDMTSPEGGFYSAEDADSEGKEGKFYFWTREELRDAVGEDRSGLVERVYNVQPGGNFRDETTRQHTGENILYLTGTSAVDSHLEEARQKLFERRKTRVHPLKDDKVLTDWNGLMIAAMARAGRVLDKASCTEAAARAAAFVATHLSRGGHRLLHRWRGGEAAIPALLDDYVYMTWGLIELYETTFDARYLQTALQYCQVCRAHFRSEDGAFYLTPDDGEALLVRTRPSYDAPGPSSNAVMMMNLLRLGHLTSDAELVHEAKGVLRAHARLMTSAPTSVTAMLSALDYTLGPSSEVFIAGSPQAADTKAMLRALRSTYLPNSVTFLRPVTPARTKAPDTMLLPRLTPYAMVDNKATAYVCEDFACKAPTTDVATMLRQLGDVCANTQSQSRLP